MPKLVTLYALSEAEQSIEQGSGRAANEQMQIPSEIVLAADISCTCVRQKKKTSVLCATQKQAEMYDEFIWQYPAEDFIPHNLFGEGPDIGTPLEIIWDAVYQNMTSLRNRSVVINLSHRCINDFARIQHIIEFVPM